VYVCVCVCVCERERERGSVCACVCSFGCVCERVNERKKKKSSEIHDMHPISYVKRNVERNYVFNISLFKLNSSNPEQSFGTSLNCII